jgi:hypothetical protein
MKTYKTLLLAATFALCGQLQAEVPEVSNIRASQLDDTKLVEILYDVEDAENDKLTIRVEISADGGERYNVPARTFEGAVGANVDSGKDKKITWNAGLDWDGEFSDKMRVRITASDGKGLPGLEWSKEIPPGGFLMGQDGGPEGSGPSKHINLKYSFWISKYEITNAQFCDFLNLYHAEGNIPIVADISIGDVVIWNVNKYEVTKEADYPARVHLNWADKFARYYGFSIPREYEWEKAARGPDHDDAGEHQNYPWGDNYILNGVSMNQISSYRPIGQYRGINSTANDMSGYGVHDLMGNPEWTLDSIYRKLNDYPSIITIPYINTIPYDNGWCIRRGVSNRDYSSMGKIFEIRTKTDSQDSRNYFRVVRRQK